MRSRFRPRPLGKLFLIAACLAASATLGCRPTPDEAELRIKVIDTSDPKAPKPLAGALVAIETGGIYVTNPDPSRGNPSFVHGAIVGDDGTLRIRLPTDQLGVHTFATGHYYGARLVEFDQDLGITVNMEPFRSPVPLPPIVMNAMLNPASVAPGAEFTISADVRAGDSTDPLSEEVIATVPALRKSRALDPPSPGIQGKMFPDGLWSATLVAPTDPGSYPYYLSATSEGCVTSDIGPPLMLEVR